MNYFAAAWTALALVMTAGCSQVDTVNLEQQVAGIERAFAATMHARDFEAFKAFLADEAVFLEREPLRGKDEIAAAWAGYFEGSAPFSWEPETVVVLDSGKLAYSTGPVYDPEGKRVMTYNSVWRREAPGVWRIVFDRGTRYCE